MAENIAGANKLMEFALDAYQSSWLAIANIYKPENVNVLGVNSQAPLDIITDGLRLVATYERRIKQVKATISQIKNTFPAAFTSITSLPDGVLAHIFRITIEEVWITVNSGTVIPPYTVGLRDPQPCCLTSCVDSTRIPSHPNNLSHVCRRWRRITTNLSSLWTHIDLSPCHPHANQLIARGKVSASRTGTLPLDIHMVEWLDYYWRKGDYLDSDTHQFCTSIATRMRSLELISGPRNGSFYKHFLAACFKRCIPGVFTQLSLRVRSDPGDINDRPGSYFIEVADSTRQGDNCLQLNISRKHFETVLRAITVLRLCNLYFRWTCQAYHGLDELRLTHQDHSVSIAKIELANILRSSPQLRVLHFALDISDESALVPPAQLNELEELVLCNVHLYMQRVVLELISPGTKPLRMHTIHSNSKRLLSSADDEFLKFFSRSNIVQLTMGGEAFGKPFRVHLSKLFELLPNLQTLTLKNAIIQGGLQVTPHCNENSPSPSGQIILHLVSSTVHSTAFWWLTSILRVKKITSYDVQIRDDNDSNRSTRRLGLAKYLEKVGEDCPIVHFIEDKEQAREAFLFYEYLDD
ncbi:hypothetical protein CTheo_3038 [Ceratobasidium theobromae]|uniref:Uncharacterized protein n=1 Tax=Ceratobasidium theobromae TaxID=1582974 RepID=A0A5N5QNZ7_9AGAM|nr:hypothetical protein CTheo_3038 [Ceratobasidium theobromae]